MLRDTGNERHSRGPNSVAYIYIYIYIHTHTYTCVCIIYIYIYVYIYIHTHTYIDTVTYWAPSLAFVQHLLQPR